MRGGENPSLEPGYGLMSPRCFATTVSSIRAGGSLGKVQFLNRCFLDHRGVRWLSAFAIARCFAMGGCVVYFLLEPSSTVINLLMNKAPGARTLALSKLHYTLRTNQTMRAMTIIVPRMPPIYIRISVSTP
jgi:hypothetical protein